MQICKFFSVLCVTALICYTTAASGDNQASQSTTSAAITAPQMPTIIVPSTPTITMPAIDENFYIPGRTIITKTTSDTNGTTTTTKAEKATATVPEKNVANKVNKVVPLSKTDSTRQTDRVSAADITALADIGALGNMSSFIGTSDTAPSKTNLLEQILTRLLKLKNEKQISPATVQTEPLPQKAENSSTTVGKKGRNGSILRFIVNGYNIIGTCRTVYFSKKETDGTFLMTGDRKYRSNGQTDSETFYLLFKASGNTGGLTTYNVNSEVSQIEKNPYSFMYRISQQHHLTAEKTGNLVTMRTTTPHLQVDLLLDIGA